MILNSDNVLYSFDCVVSLIASKDRGIISLSTINYIVASITLDEIFTMPRKYFVVSRPPAYNVFSG